MKLSIVLLVLGLSGLAAGATTFVRASIQTEADVHETYYANGQVRSRSSARPDGEAWVERWHANGTKQAEGALVGGRMHGDWQFWTPDGALDAERSGIFHAGTKQNP